MVSLPLSPSLSPSLPLSPPLSPSLPLSSPLSLSLSPAPLPPSPSFSDNLYTLLFQEHLYQVCLETGDSGEDATPLFTNYPDLLGDRWWCVCVCACAWACMLACMRVREREGGREGRRGGERERERRENMYACVMKP